MLKVSNIKKYPDCNWEEYCKMPGYSFSFLKNDGADIPDSDGIRLGKSVHTYLLKPYQFDWDATENLEIVIAIATRLKDYYILSGGLTECAITADLEYEGMIMPWRGMPDWHFEGLLTIDFKVINGDLDNYIKQFYYDHQLRGYMLPTYCQDGMIVAWNRKTKGVQTRLIKPDPRWWIHKIKQYGRVATT